MAANAIGNQKTYRLTGTAVKRLEGNRFGGYLVRFTDMTRPDLTGEYFDDDTDFMLSAYPIQGKANALYHHADDRSVRAIPLNVIDSVEYHPGKGIWGESQNNFAANYKAYLRELEAPEDWKARQEELAKQYQDMIDDMIDSGKLAWSSGTLPNAYETDKSTGHIKCWPIVEGSLTPTPAEPLGTRVSTMKSLFDALFREHPGNGSARETADDKSNRDTANHIELDRPSTGDDIMKRSAIKAQISDRVAELLAALVEELNIGMAAGESVAMADEEVQLAQAAMEEEAVAMLEEDMDKAEDMETEEEVKKSLSPRFNDVAKDVLNAGVKAYYEARSARRDAYRKSAQDAIRDLRQSDGVSPKQSAGAGNGATKNGRISVGENLKYAHLSGSDMALVAQLIKSSYPAAQRSRLQLGDLVSEDFMRHMANKAVADVERNDKRDLRDTNAIKSILPFKANELDASDIATQGQEWVGVYYSTTIWERARNEAQLYNIMASKGMMVETIEKGYESAYFPLEDADPIVYTTFQANNVDSTGRPEITAKITPFNTGRVQVTPGEQKLATSYTVILEEDALVNISAQVNTQIAKKMAENVEQSMLNADSTTTANTNINLIDGTPGTGLNAPYYLAFDGIRKHFLVTYVGTQGRSAGGSLALSDFRATLALLDKTVRARRNELLWVMDFDTETATLAIPEIATRDVAEGNATIFSGVVPPIYKIDPYVSGFLELSNSAGKVPAAGGTLGTLALIYSPYWGYAHKRDVTIETGRDILSGSDVWVASIRHAMVARGANAAVGSYNVGV